MRENEKKFQEAYRKASMLYGRKAKEKGHLSFQTVETGYTRSCQDSSPPIASPRSRRRSHLGRITAAQTRNFFLEEAYTKNLKDSVKLCPQLSRRATQHRQGLDPPPSNGIAGKRTNILSQSPTDQVRTPIDSTSLFPDICSMLD